MDKAQLSSAGAALTFWNLLLVASLVTALSAQHVFLRSRVCSGCPGPPVCGSPSLCAFGLAQPARGGHLGMTQNVEALCLSISLSHSGTWPFRIIHLIDQLSDLLIGWSVL